MSEYAFPHDSIMVDGGNKRAGMTLLDYFAGKAMGAFCQGAQVRLLTFVAIDFATRVVALKKRVLFCPLLPHPLFP